MPLQVIFPFWGCITRVRKHTDDTDLTDQHRFYMNAEIIKKELLALSDPEKRAFLPHFFKTGKGGYGEGDKFIGVVVPKQRELIKKYKVLELEEVEKLLTDEYHECRLTALLFLVNMFTKFKDEHARKEIYEFYIAHVDYINNWDLVDLSARDIVGGYLFDKDRNILKKYAKENHLWLQRISIISTYFFIREREFEETFAISDLLINHPHDLIHKATGWMLREVGNRDFNALYQHITQDNRYQKMPRTMLRYTIEKFPEELRKQFLRGEIQ